MSDLYIAESVDTENPVEGDLALTNGQARLTEEHLEATAQRVRIKLRFVEGEWYLDQRLGVPIWRKVLVKNPDVPGIVSMHRRILLGVEGVAVVNRITPVRDRAARTLTLEIALTTDEGAELLLTEPFIVER